MARRRWAGAMWTWLRRSRSSRQPCSRRPSCQALGAWVVLAAALLPHRAVAGSGIRLAVEWDKLGELLRRQDASLPAWQPDADHPMPPTPQSEPHSLLDGIQGPGRWSLVAHDWEAARPLIGRLAPTDEVKHGRSKRMVLLRGRFVEGPVAPFVQLGLGQWRIDPDMPALPHDAMLAGQVGAGVELALATWASVALEANCTLLDPGRLGTPEFQPRQLPDPQFLLHDVRWVHPSALWGSFVALRARF
jgi:hypothetical protein